MAAAGLLENPVGLAFTGIQFLQSIRNLATLDIKKEDAELLIIIFRIAQEETLDFS